ncbi:MAG: DNA translocase FtsK 4TM domain-containing protein, partial [Pseudomonadota bacterium]|nr:DNA translocase FtsK 4TM domain-containing protein [Pseudomonadota bacterium]
AWTHTGGAAAPVANLGGVAGAWFADVALYFLGYLAWLLPVGVLLAGWVTFHRPGLNGLDPEVLVFRGLGFLVTLLAGCGLAALHLPVSLHALSGSAGGIVGDMVGLSLVRAFNPVGGTLLLLALFLAGVTLATGLSWLGVIDMVGKLTLDGFDGVCRLVGVAGDGPPPAPADSARPAKMIDIKPASRVEPVLEVLPVAVTAGCAGGFPPLVGGALPPEPAFGEIDDGDVPRPAPSRRALPAGIEAPAALPPLDLLDLAAPGRSGYSDEDIKAMSRQVEALLESFGIDVQVVAVEPGPVITRFEMQPAPGVKVNQISSLAKDLARGLSVVSVRVVEVIPGKSVVGLEIPNRQREIVYLRDVLGSPAGESAASPLTLALGKDIGGRPVVADLARMPHLLVAGTTGSGKSVALNAMLLSILYRATPRDVRLILVDPKMLELSVYEGVPHLLAPVVTDMKDAANALRWCVGEMERRYRLMAALQVRNIAGFNRKVLDALQSGAPIADPLHRPEEHLGEEPAALAPLPFIVVVIDELADMMMVVGKKVEELIARLAQKARASGIHLILATQRPSVNVITGLIKANIPTRIAFQVSSMVDSKTILDQRGAEQLLGHGDMLYLPPGVGFPQRVHGAFVDDHEVHKVVEYLKASGAPDYRQDVLDEAVDSAAGFASEAGGEAADGESDPLYDQAVRIVTESRRGSTSAIQRRLKIGYNRAARLMEVMESAGIVGPLQSNGSREVLAPPPPEV